MVKKTVEVSGNCSSRFLIMHLGKNNSLREYNIGGTRLASTTEEKSLWLLVSDDCKMSSENRQWEKQIEF